MSSSSENEDTEMVEQPDSDEEESQSGAEDEDQPQMDASDTESDDDDDEEADDDEDIPKNKKKTSLSSNQVAKITNTIKARHVKRQGKQLYIRFPNKLPLDAKECEEMVKALSPLITDVHKPRQKHARFCLVDFASTDDRDKAMNKIKESDQKIVVALPKTDDDEFVKVLIEKKIKQSERRRAKNLLRKEGKKDLGAKKQFTPSILIKNVPKSASNAQIKELFPNAIDIQIKSTNSKAAHHNIVSVTFASTNDATKSARKKVELGGVKLKIRFTKDSKKLKNKDAPATSEQSENGISEVSEKKINKNNKSKESKKVNKKPENGNSKEPEKKTMKMNKLKESNKKKEPKIKNASSVKSSPIQKPTKQILQKKIKPLKKKLRGPVAPAE